MYVYLNNYVYLNFLISNKNRSFLKSLAQSNEIIRIWKSNFGSFGIVFEEFV